MDSTSPPVYSTTTTSNASSSSLLLNLAPLTNHVDFLHGHLGYGPASLEGEVQLKKSGDSPLTARPSRLEVCFRGVERHQGSSDIELVDQRKTLWGLGAQGPSTAIASDQDGDLPPSSIMFKLDVTRDLPHCIHLHKSSLEYTLTATLYFDDHETLPLIQCVPIHLARTSAPGVLLLADHAGLSTSRNQSQPSLTPTIISLQDPIRLSAKFSRTVFKRSEPIEVVVRIEVPDVDVVAKGLRLRTVSAELVRKIELVGVNSGAIPSTTDDRLEDGSRFDHSLDRTAGRSAEQAHTIQPNSTTDPISTTVLAKSGKSARFSPTRPIIIRLLLHPMVHMSCESITQSTILHQISFSVVARVGLWTNRAQNDVTVSQDIFIVPDPPATLIRNEKQREVESEDHAWLPADGPVPAYHESAEEQSEASYRIPKYTGEGSSRLPLISAYAGLLPDGEEEYDGYEEMSASLSTRAPPPTIDEDVSPPSHDKEDSSSDESFESFRESLDVASPTVNAQSNDFGNLYLPVDATLRAQRRHLESDDEEDGYVLPAGLESAFFTSSTTSTPPSGVDSAQVSASNSPAFHAIQETHPTLVEASLVAPLDEASPPPYAGGGGSTRTAVPNDGEAPRSPGSVSEMNGSAASTLMRPPPPSYTSHQEVLLRLNERGEVVVRNLEGVI